jgi:hypothetical protein
MVSSTGLRRHDPGHGEQAPAPAARSKQNPFRASAASTHFTPPTSRLVRDAHPARCTPRLRTNLPILSDGHAAAECRQRAESGRLVSASGPLAALWRADQREAHRGRPGVELALPAAGQPRGIRLPHRAIAPLGAGPPRHAGKPGPRSRSILLSFPHSLRSPPVDQLALAFTPPGIGHSQPPEAMDPIERLNDRLSVNCAEQSWQRAAEETGRTLAEPRSAPRPGEAPLS